MISAIRSLLHLLFMAVTVIPWSLAAVLLAPFIGKTRLYWFCQRWLKLSVDSARWIIGIRYQVLGRENLPPHSTDPAVLLVKHQSTWETFAMPAVMPHPLAYVFKKELLSIPFFGWAIGRLDMIHIDRSDGARAFAKVVQQGRRLLEQGTVGHHVPRGTRIARGQKGQYKTGGTRLAIKTGAPVIPVAVTSAKCWPRKALFKRPGLVEISIGKPIPSVGREHDELMAEVEAWIEAEMRRLDPEAYAQPA